MSWRSERMPSKNMTSCSLKKTTGSMLGPAPLGVELARPVADEAQVELRLQVAVEVVRRERGPPARRRWARRGGGVWAGRA